MSERGGDTPNLLFEWIDQALPRLVGEALLYRQVANMNPSDVRSVSVYEGYVGAIAAIAGSDPVEVDAWLGRHEEDAS